MERKIVIVADSSANLYSSEDGSLKSVPLKIRTAEREFVDDEKLDVNEMVEYLANHKGRSSTACPSVGEWLAAFEGADEVFGVAITSHLSGCYNAACIAKDDYLQEDSSKKVYIIDSLSTGPEMELIVEKLKELISLNLSFEKIKEDIEQYVQKTHLIFSLESLNNFVNNGRVSKLVASAASLLGIRIVGRASVDGELEPLHKCRGEKKTIKQLFDLMNEMGFTGGKLRIRHSQNEEAANKLADMVKESYPDCDLKVGANKGLCSYYAEGGILVGFESE